MNLPTSFSNINLPDKSKLTADGNYSLDFLLNLGYELKIGAQAEILEELKRLSLEPGIREYCPNDIDKRFGSLDLFNQWLSKGRALITLWHSDELVGYGWAGSGHSEKVGEGKNTFAIRLGSAASGKGLATHFARLIIECGNAIFSLQDYWLETWQSNGGAVHIYHKIGFIDVDSESSKRQRPDGSHVDDVRIYMMLPNDKLPQYH